MPSVGSVSLACTPASPSSQSTTSTTAPARCSAATASSLNASSAAASDAAAAAAVRSRRLVEPLTLRTLLVVPFAVLLRMPVLLVERERLSWRTSLSEGRAEHEHPGQVVVGVE